MCFHPLRGSGSFLPQPMNSGGELKKIPNEITQHLHIIPAAICCPPNPTHQPGARPPGSGAQPQEWSPHTPLLQGRGQQRGPRRPPGPGPPRPSGVPRPPGALCAAQARLQPAGSRQQAAGARLAARSRLCSFMIRTRPPGTQPERRREGRPACGRRGGRTAAPAPHAALAG